jgi:hypothetical protein
MRLFLVAALMTAVFAGVALLAGYPSRLTPGEGGDPGHSERAGDGQPTGMGAPTGGPLPGVQVAQDGLRLAIERSTFAAAASSEPFSFRVVDAHGRPVRDFELQHETRMHLIVVRRDLAGFQHVHPTMRMDGTWTTAIEFGEGGTYRVFADFRRDGEQRTLGADVQVGGRFRPRPLPAPARLVRTDGGDLEVALRADGTTPREDVRLEFDVRDDGQVVTDRLDSYLGAKGHLVALRDGDLAYLHTHPERDELTFTLSYPSAGAYRLFAQFQFRGRVHTAAFTQRVAE